MAESNGWVKSRPLHTAIDILSENRYFSQLSGTELAEIACHAQFYSIAKGGYFAVAGRHMPGVAILINGLLCAGAVSPHGNEFMLSMTEFDGLVGLAMILGGKPAFRDCRAIVDTEILLIPRTFFTEWLDRNLHLYKVFVEVLCDRIKSAHRIIDELALMPLSERMARVLRTLASASRGYQNGTSITLNLTQDELASLLGVTRHAVNRELKRLQDTGGVLVGYRSIIITPLLEKAF